jgi:osmotically-inducible protein OsmY
MGVRGAAAFIALLALALGLPARSQVLGALQTAMDARTADEVKSDIEIAASANKRLLDDKRAQWRGVSLLVFARHVVIAGAVKSEEARKAVEDAVRKVPRVRSVTSDLIVVKKEGDDGSLVKDTAMDTKVNAVLTATGGISSINMRWSSLNGTVVIMGIAQSKAEADLAYKKIRGLDGVKTVKSHLRVVPKRKR